MIVIFRGICQLYIFSFFFSIISCIEEVFLISINRLVKENKLDTSLVCVSNFAIS